jgi:T-box protein 1
MCIEIMIVSTEHLRNAGTGKKLSTSSSSQGSDPRNLDDGPSSAHSSPSSTSGSPPSTPTASSLAHLRVELEMKNLWDEFYSLGTEMIVTKAGR